MIRNNKITFSYSYSGFRSTPWRVLKFWKKEFSYFCQILNILGLFNQYNHEKLTKIKIILEMCVVKFKKLQIPQEVTSSLNTTKILSKKGWKISFSEFWPIEICRICIKTIQDKLQHYTDEMNQLQVPTDHICVHPEAGGQFAYFDQKWPKIMVFW